MIPADVDAIVSAYCTEYGRPPIVQLVALELALEALALPWTEERIAHAIDGATTLTGILVWEDPDGWAGLLAMIRDVWDETAGEAGELLFGKAS